MQQVLQETAQAALYLYHISTLQLWSEVRQWKENWQGLL